MWWNNLSPPSLQVVDARSKRCFDISWLTKDQTHPRSFIQCWNYKYGFVGDIIRQHFVNIASSDLKWEDLSHSSHSPDFSISIIICTSIIFLHWWQKLVAKSDMYSQYRFLQLQERREHFGVLGWNVHFLTINKHKIWNFTCWGGRAFLCSSEESFAGYTTSSISFSSFVS